jgi:hypothetical protein
MVGRFPEGVKAPNRVVPQADTPDSAIDDFLQLLQKLKEFKGEFAPHPRLGHVGHDDFIRLHLIHCAHHLSFLWPTKSHG